MSQDSTPSEFEAAYSAIGQIAEDFKNLECRDCARAILRWLSDNGYEGKLLRIRTGWGEDFMMSRRLEARRIYESITENGTHYGVQVGELVFDNLSTSGLNLEDWLSDFECQSEEIILDEPNSVGD